VYQVAAERLPASAALRASLNTALWAGGRIELAAPKAEWIAARNSDSADAAWHAGYARMLVAEEYRRSEAPDRAIDSYARAVTWFESSVRLKAEYLETSDHYRAMCAFGSGFAHLLANRREVAGQCLVEGLSIRPQAASARDGLDREAVDLLDGSLEWRTEGASPVDAMNLLNDLERVDPGNPLWPRSISDSELREALRADGRGEVVECDRYLRMSIEAGRRAISISQDSETLRALAQSLTISAERFLERGDTDQARECLLEAAPLLGEESTPTPADETALRALAKRLRERLGAARPRFRPGR
jgi:tetratricopeptide (TPR) repeat protein